MYIKNWSYLSPPVVLWKPLAFKSFIAAIEHFWTSSNSVFCLKYWFCFILSIFRIPLANNLKVTLVSLVSFLYYFLFHSLTIVFLLWFYRIIIMVVIDIWNHIYIYIIYNEKYRLQLKYSHYNFLLIFNF